MPDANTNLYPDRPMYDTACVLDGKVERYETPAVTPFEMAMYAITFVDVIPDGDFERYALALDEANRFATFCIGETIEPDGEFCDPTRSFADLWGRFVRTPVEA